MRPPYPENSGIATYVVYENGKTWNLNACVLDLDHPHIVVLFDDYYTDFGEVVWHDGKLRGSHAVPLPKPTPGVHRIYTTPDDIDSAMSNLSASVATLLQADEACSRSRSPRSAPSPSAAL